MIKLSVIEDIIESQRNRLVNNDSGLQRQLLENLDYNLSNFALIISGIRRCGKSTLLHQLINRIKDNFLYLNFDSPKLYNFEMDDFAYLDSIIKNSKIEYLLFDEIQLIKGWELYVREKLDENYKVIITGSNASLLSKELGTNLTGRHITKELFPFSFNEYVQFKQFENNSQSLQSYLDEGGFPEYIKLGNNEILKWLVEDILYRDIAVRNNIRDVDALKKLLIYLVSNVANLITASKMTQFSSIKSRATVMEYFNFLEQTYLIEFVSKFSYSYKSQILNPRKIYVIDNGLLNEITNSFSKDEGRKLENMVYWELRRKGFEINYYNENNKECDFVAIKKNKPEMLIQVCYQLNINNEKREIEGLLDAMKYFNFEKGIILSFDQKDKIIKNNKIIDIIPVYSYFSKI